MRTKTLTEKFNLLFSQEKRLQAAELQELRDTLKQLKAKQKELQSELKECPEEALKIELTEKISILATQRRKGINKLRYGE